MRLKNVELQLKQRELDSKARELVLKKQEAGGLRWRSPPMVALITGLGTLAKGSISISSSNLVMRSRWTVSSSNRM